MSADEAKAVGNQLPFVSVGKGIDWRNSQQKPICLSVIYKQTKQPTSEHKQTIQYLRELVRQRDHSKDAEQKKKLGEQVDKIKKGLPAFTVSGTFPSGQRQKDMLIQHSGRLQIDVDKLPADQVQLVKEQLATDPHMEAIFLSPSGRCRGAWDCVLR